MDANKHWFKDGLKFECNGCGKCCCGEPGFIWVNTEEIKEISLFLNIETEEFISKYTFTYNNKRSLREVKISESNYDCIFLKNNQCEIYEARPTQCRTYPWWPAILKSKKSWKEEKPYCEGISAESKNVPAEEILKQLKKQEQYIKTLPLS